MIQRLPLVLIVPEGQNRKKQANNIQTVQSSSNLRRTFPDDNGAIIYKFIRKTTILECHRMQMQKQKDGGFWAVVRVIGPVAGDRGGHGHQPPADASKFLYFVVKLERRSESWRICNAFGWFGKETRDQFEASMKQKIIELQNRHSRTTKCNLSPICMTLLKFLKNKDLYVAIETDESLGPCIF